jgi:non-ribosomal peptide synthetase component F
MTARPGQPPSHLNGELTIGDLIDWRRRETPDHVFCRFQGRDVTCEALATDVNRIANALTAMGLRSGDRVGTMLSNGPGHVAAMLAILRLGLVWVPVNTQLKGRSFLLLRMRIRRDHRECRLPTPARAATARPRAPSSRCRRTRSRQHARRAWRSGPSSEPPAQPRARRHGRDQLHLGDD